MKHVFTFKNAVLVFFICVCIFMIGKINHIQRRVDTVTKPNNPFAVSNIISKYEMRPEWDVQVKPEVITFVNLVSQQPFYWLGKGFQAYAFLSEDGQYVLKFIQQKRLREDPKKTHPFNYAFSGAFRDRMEYRQKHREEIFSSSKMCFEEIPEESGILYVHLNRSNNLIKHFKVNDMMNQSHKVQGDEVSFVLQKKAKYVFPTLIELMDQGKIDQAKVRLDHIFDLLVSLAKKKIVDFDYALIQNNNIGFTKDRAIYIDTGHIAKVDDLDILNRVRHEFGTRLKPLHDWLKINYPELRDYYETATNQIIQALENEEHQKQIVTQDVENTIAKKEPYSELDIESKDVIAASAP